MQTRGLRELSFPMRDDVSRPVDVTVAEIHPRRTMGQSRLFFPDHDSYQCGKDKRAPHPA